MRNAANGAPAQPASLPPQPTAALGVPIKRGSAAERAVSILRRNLGGPRVIAFANPKGGVHKTTATVLTAAAIGGARGRGVIAWDDNELRGTLGLRAGSARHAKTIRHLVSELAEVELNSGPALAARIDDFLRHASDGTYDVLAGEEDPRFSWRLDPPTVRRVLDLLTRTHEVVCVDTGNNVESGNWRTIMETADQLVITTVPREDSAFSADWMMDVLTEAGRPDLIANAVTIISMTTPRPGPMHDDLVRHFRSRNRAVCVVPYDPVLEQGGWIDHTVLAQATREAWLEAAAVIMEPLGS
jgi:MinD-like ATPase involved in chromosome partitioning or flagellar assembly